MGVVSTPREIGEDGGEGAPLSDVEVVAVLRESAERDPSMGALGASRVPSISWILNFCPSTLPLLRLVRGMPTPLLRVRSISHVILELVGEGVDRRRLINTPSQILECHPHGYIETVRVPSLDDSLQHLANIETVFRQLHGIFVVDQFVLVRSSRRVHKRAEWWHQPEPERGWR